MNFQGEQQLFRRMLLLDITVLLNAERIWRWEDRIRRLIGLEKVMP